MKTATRIVLKEWFLTAVILFSVMLSCLPAMAAPPANDAIDNARVINAEGEFLTVDLSEATVDPGEPVCADEVFQSVWFAYTATENQFVTISIGADDAADNLFPGVAVWTFGDSQDLESVECPWDAEEIGFMVTFGRTYYIQVFFFVPEKRTNRFYIQLDTDNDSVPKKEIAGTSVGCDDLQTPPNQTHPSIGIGSSIDPPQWPFSKTPPGYNPIIVP